MTKETVRYKQIDMCTIIGHKYQTRRTPSKYGVYLVLTECIVCGKVIKSVGKDKDNA